MEFDEAADELYALPPEQFTARRTELEKQARADGDRRLATRIHALRKPNQVAALANLLARRRPDEVEPLLALGAGLREAEAGLTGDALREFTKQKRQLVGALLDRARGLAGEDGRPVGDETLRGIETTLDAALADESAADALRGARLTTGLSYSGFGSVPTGLATVTPLRPGLAGRSSPVDEPRAAVRPGSGLVAAAERRLAAAIAAEEAAVALRDEASAAADAADLAVAGAEDDVARLRESLAQAERALASATGERRRTRKSLDRGQREADRTERRLLDAQRQRDALGADDD